MSKTKWGLLLLIFILGIFYIIGLLVKVGIRIENYNKTKEFTEKQIIFFEINLSEKNKLKKYLYDQVAGNYHKYSKLRNTIECESNFNQNALGDHGKAKNICQFHEETFNRFAKLSGIKELEYNDARDQIKLIVWAYENKKMNNWTCWGKG